MASRISSAEVITPITRGTLKSPALGRRLRRLRERDVARQRRRDLVRAQLGWRADGMRRRGDAAGVELLDLLGVGEEVGELPAEERRLVRREREAREPRQALDVCRCGEPFGHGES